MPSSRNIPQLPTNLDLAAMPKQLHSLPALLLVLILSVSTTIKPTNAQERQTAAEIYGRAAITELWEPEPKLIQPGSAQTAPSDATVLFDGSSLAAWESVDGDEVQWLNEDGVLIVEPGSGLIKTKENFGSVQLHVEWRTPAVVAGDSQDRGNSGIFLMEQYELQVLDSIDNPTYVNGQAGSIYKQHIPLVNASLGPGQWQSYDIVFMAPLFGTDGRLVRPATFTVFQNGILIQNNVTVQGPTEFIGKPNYLNHSEMPLALQDHGSPVAYRNIWLRKL
jgi:hypothetical protein